MSMLVMASTAVLSHFCVYQDATVIRTYKALILSTFLYAAETWTVRAEDARILENCHMKCQRQILGIRWQDHVRNAEVIIQTGLPSVIDHIVKRRNAIFGHIARMPSNVLVCLHQALSCQVDLSLGRPPDRSWKRRPGRPPKRWLDQIQPTPPADVWRDVVRRSHRGATQRSSTTTR